MGGAAGDDAMHIWPLIVYIEARARRPNCMGSLYMYIQMDKNAGPPAAAVTESNRVYQLNNVLNNNVHHLNAKGAGRIKKTLRHVLPVEQWRRIGPVFLAVVIIVVWGLLSLPIIFYHLPQDQV